MKNSLFHLIWIIILFSSMMVLSVAFHQGNHVLFFSGMGIFALGAITAIYMIGKEIK